MPIVAIVIAVIVVLLLLVLIKNVVVVRQSRAYVIERLGAFHAVWGVGIHFKLPFIERVAKVVSLKEASATVPLLTLTLSRVNSKAILPSSATAGLVAPIILR